MIPVRITNWYAKQCAVLETMNLYIISTFMILVRITSWYAKQCDILEALNVYILSNGYDTSLNYQLICEAVWHIGDIELVYYFHVYDTSQNYQLICETEWHIGDNEFVYSFQRLWY